MTPDNPEVTMVWQPIETAPKDGTRVLVYPVHHHNAPAKRYEQHAVIAYWYGSSWIGVRGQNASPLLTHWMPLPPPPALSEGVKGGDHGA